MENVLLTIYNVFCKNVKPEPQLL